MKYQNRQYARRPSWISWFWVGSLGLDPVRNGFSILKTSIYKFSCFLPKVNILYSFSTYLLEVTLLDYNPKGKYRIECRATQTPDNCEGRIRCHGGVTTKHPLLTGHIHRAPLVEIRCMRLPVVKASNGNDSLTYCMKQIIQHISQWLFVIANKVIIATVEFAKWWL
jgi:hypothetical protein